MHPSRDRLTPQELHDAKLERQLARSQHRVNKIKKLSSTNQGIITVHRHPSAPDAYGSIDPNFGLPPLSTGPIGGTRIGGSGMPSSQITQAATQGGFGTVGPMHASANAMLGQLFPEKYSCKLAQEHTIPTLAVQVETNKLCSAVNAAAGVYRGSVTVGPWCLNHLEVGSAFSATNPWDLTGVTSFNCAGYSNFTSQNPLVRCTGLSVHVTYIPSANAQGIMNYGLCNQSTSTTLEANWELDTHATVDLSTTKSLRGLWRMHFPTDLEFQLSTHNHVTDSTNDLKLNFQLMASEPFQYFVTTYMNFESVPGLSLSDLVNPKRSVFNSALYDDVNGALTGLGMFDPRVSSNTSPIDGWQASLNEAEKVVGLVEQGLAIGDKIANFFASNPNAVEAESIAAKVLMTPPKLEQAYKLIESFSHFTEDDIRSLMLDAKSENPFIPTPLTKMVLEVWKAKMSLKWHLERELETFYPTLIYQGAEYKYEPPVVAETIRIESPMRSLPQLEEGESKTQ